MIDWKSGLYLGAAMRSNESLIGTHEGVVKVWIIRRVTPEERWNFDTVASMKRTPSQSDPGKPGGLHVQGRIEGRIGKEQEQE